MTIKSRPIDAKVLSDKIHEYMRDYPNATARLSAGRAILSMLGDENQTPTRVEFSPDSAKMVPLKSNERHCLTCTNSNCPNKGQPISFYGVHSACNYIPGRRTNSTDRDFKNIVFELRAWANGDTCDGCPGKDDLAFQAADAILLLLARAEEAEARCKTLEKMVREYQDVIVPGYRERAEKAERDRDEAREVICARCRVLPCRGNECYWYRGQKEE